MLHSDRKAWNENVVRFLLEEESRNTILNTPLFNAVHIDSIYWIVVKSGMYSVRSAYKLIMQPGWFDWVAELLLRGVPTCLRGRKEKGSVLHS